MVRATTFNSDSMPIMVDDGASACITNTMEDFVGKTQCINQKVNGIAGNAQATCQGMVHWQIEDDDGVQHTLKIKGCYYIETIPTRIFSPQYFAQLSNDHTPLPEGMGAIMLSRNITLFWHQHHFTKTIPLDPKMNVGLTYLVPGANRFKAFLVDILTQKEPRVFESHIILPDEETRVFKLHITLPDDDDASFQPQDLVESNEELREPSNEAEGQLSTPNRHKVCA